MWHLRSAAPTHDTADPQPETFSLDDLRIDRDEPEAGTSLGRRLAVMAVVAMLLVVGTWWMQRRPTAVRTQIVRAPQAVDGKRVVLNASGYVVARRAATVSSKVTGKVIDVQIEEGMDVAAGQVLARLDASNIQVNLELAHAQLQATRSAMSETQVRLGEAQKEWRRVSALTERHINSPSDLDAAQAEVESLKARLKRQAQEAVVAERQIAVLQQELDDTVIRAPFAGKAVSKDAQPGEMISPVSAGGGFTRTGIGTIVDMESLEIEVDVNESYIHRVQPGQAVRARLDAYPDWAIPCQVLAIIPTADRQKATITVRVAFEQLEPRILPEMGVKVTFLDTGQTGRTTIGIPIPETALHQDGDQAFLWLVRDGRLDKRLVTVAQGSGGEVVVQTGLAAGERIVVEGPSALAVGQRVREKP
ncbi:MAG: efflux RND transporter periplasmic adaptor subunit [Candidatus Tectomicrobia bacterium]|nr:efflux RND transporter periplasmic adaptor subunit [Candidatus Tectomicrobia bacterium]